MKEQNKEPLCCEKCGEQINYTTINKIIKDKFPKHIPCKVSFIYVCETCGENHPMSTVFSIHPTKEEQKRYDVEESILGSLMLDSSISSEIDSLTEEMFEHKKHKIIFKAIEYLYRNDKPIDLITVSDVLRKNNELEKIGGADRLVKILNSVTSAKHIKEYINELKDQ